MGRINKPWGYVDTVLMTQVDIGNETGMLGMRKLVIDSEEMTSYSKHSKQNDIIYLESGSATVRIDGKMEELNNGNGALIIRAGQKHQIQNIGSKVAEMLEISFPYDPEDIERIEDPYSQQRTESKKQE